MSQPLNFLCISTFFKGQDFLKSCKAEGNRVFLLTKKNLENEDWPWESIDEVFYMEDWVDDHVKNWIAYKFRSIAFDRFIALDDFDVEKVAHLREHFRMPGLGESTARFFRDKLAMRMKAKESGINVPAFCSLFNDENIRDFVKSTQAPWLIKPRLEASATGIRKIQNEEELWAAINELGDKRQHYLVEKFAPGDVYHVDALSFGEKVIFSMASMYLDTPFEVAHGGGIFRSHTIELGSDDDHALRKMNESVTKSFGLGFGASHTEFIKSKDTGEFFFLETSARVGGANLAEMVHAASGINLWSEWARIESATFKHDTYTLPEINNTHAGIVVSLSRYEHPDTSSFQDTEIVWRMKKPWHIGMIVSAPLRARILELLDDYTTRIASEFHASLPPPDRSVS